MGIHQIQWEWLQVTSDPPVLVCCEVSWLSEKFWNSEWLPSSGMGEPSADTLEVSTAFLTILPSTASLTEGKHISLGVCSLPVLLLSASQTFLRKVFLSFLPCAQQGSLFNMCKWRMVSCRSPTLHGLADSQQPSKSIWNHCAWGKN